MLKNKLISAMGGAPANYIEDVFSTYLYTGNGSTQTITNGIDLAGKGGLVWMKGRSGATDHAWYDTARGTTKDLVSNSTAAETTQSTGLTSFASTGFSLGSLAKLNTNAATYASWTFRKQPKFFDVVTYTGNGANRTIAHNLGSVPGCIIVKRTDTTGDWQVYHQSLANTEYMVLNATAAKATGATRWNSTTPTSTVFSVGTDATVNASGGTYVAYIFAHNAGGFGLTGTDNVITCGSYVGNGAVGQEINLGFEPQWLLVKNASAAVGWAVVDSMRGLPYNGNTAYLSPELALQENWGGLGGFYGPTPTGFRMIRGADPYTNVSGQTYIYIAIRRGPMKVPTDGTKVFEPVLYAGDNATSRTFTSSTVSPVDSAIALNRTADGNIWWVDRLRGNGVIRTDYSDAETGAYSSLKFDYQNGYSNNANPIYFSWNNTGNNNLNYFLKRAPGFFDEVCYTGTGSYPFNINHNLGVVPELMIIKTRNFADSWYVYVKPITSPQSNWYQNFLVLNGTVAASSDTTSLTTSPTSTTIPVSDYFGVSTRTYVAYLFATCPGVSKVGSYTGTGTTQQINCGFAAGSRLVLIKRTDSTGDWYVWDSARGIVAGNDPYLLLNSTAAEVTGTDYVDTYSAGFEISSTAPAAINASGGTFIFLAIA